MPPMMALGMCVVSMDYNNKRMGSYCFRAGIFKVMSFTYFFQFSLGSVL